MIHMITISETNVKVLRLSLGDIEDEEDSACENIREKEEPSFEAQSDDSPKDIDSTDERCQLNLSAGTRTRIRRMP